MSDARPAEHSCPLYLVDPAGKWVTSRRTRRGGKQIRACTIRSGRDLQRHFAEAERKAVWVASDASLFALLARQEMRPFGEWRLLLLDPVQQVTHHILSVWFRYVVIGANGIHILPLEELLEVLTSPHRDELFIGGAVDPDEAAVVLYRGHLEPMVIPLEWFDQRPEGPAPDPGAFEITDYGQTIRLGEYEAAADAILYEFDPAYRKRARTRALERDKTLGGSIRRLRLQTGLGRDAFPKVTEKTLARIERNEVARPHRRTLERIAGTLGVSVEQLGTY